MRKLVLYSMVVLLAAACNHDQTNRVRLTKSTKISLASKERGKELLLQEDAYTKHMSVFDLHSKTGVVDGNPTIETYFENAVKEVKDWTPEEQKLLNEIIQSVSTHINELGLNLNLPPVVEVVRTTGKEEGTAAGYTRGNYIVLGGAEISEELFIHELFHVYSRHNPDKREQIYNSIGFYKTNEIEYPNSLAELTIANPDAPINDYYIEVEYEGKPVKAMMVIFSMEKYNGGSFFEYLHAKLLMLEGTPGKTMPVIRNGEPLLVRYAEVANLFEQIGKNTNYIIHPEEISASHFTLLLMGKEDLPNPEIIDAMKDILSSK